MKASIIILFFCAAVVGGVVASNTNLVVTIKSLALTTNSTLTVTYDVSLPVGGRIGTMQTATLTTNLATSGAAMTAISNVLERARVVVQAKVRAEQN